MSKYKLVKTEYFTSENVLISGIEILKEKRIKKMLRKLSDFFNNYPNEKLVVNALFNSTITFENIEDIISNDYDIISINKKTAQLFQNNLGLDGFGACTLSDIYYAMKSRARETAQTSVNGDSINIPCQTYFPTTTGGIIKDWITTISNDARDN